MDQHIIYVGLDVHKDTIAVALAETGKRGEVREHGKVGNTPTALKTLAVKLARNGARLRFCYEAGVDWHFNLRLWGTGTISGISCETLAGLVSIERVMQCGVLFG